MPRPKAGRLWVDGELLPTAGEEVTVLGMLTNPESAEPCGAWKLEATDGAVRMICGMLAKVREREWRDVLCEREGEVLLLYCDSE
jgi:hypothetical protein